MATITTIVRPTGGPAGISAASTSKTVIPHREEIFQASQLSSPEGIRDALHTIQRHTAESTQAARSSPLQGGTFWPDIQFSANTAHSFTHGVDTKGRVSWIVGSIRPGALSVGAIVVPGFVEISQDYPHGKIVLGSNLDCTADIWFVPKPSAAK